MRDYRVKPIESLARGLLVLQTLQEMRAASLHDLHLATGIPKPTLTRILHTAHRSGLVWQRMVDGAFLPSHVQRRREPDDDAWLVEIASPVLEELSRRLQWPSVLSVPRLDYMETLETNSSRTYFDALPPRPHGFRVNMLGSASGRAYLAYCTEQEFDAVIARLRHRDVPAHHLAFDDEALRRLVGDHPGAGLRRARPGLRRRLLPAPGGGRRRPLVDRDAGAARRPGAREHQPHLAAAGALVDRPGPAPSRRPAGRRPHGGGARPRGRPGRLTGGGFPRPRISGMTRVCARSSTTGPVPPTSST